ncbi:MAG: hypothetical protein LBC42_02500 [Puniceicoccales bacterium]|nr:hypothetical protein [Puniceicoccales bacterium]
MVFEEMHCNCGGKFLGKGLQNAAPGNDKDCSHSCRAFFALDNLYPRYPEGLFLPGTLKRVEYAVGNFSIIADCPTATDAAFFWATKQFDGSPGQRLLEMAFALAEVRESCGGPLTLILPYADCSRSNSGNCIRAYLRMLETLRADLVVLFDLHGGNYLKHYCANVLQIPTLPFWAKYVSSIRSDIDIVISPDNGRRECANWLARTLNVRSVCMDKRIPYDFTAQPVHNQRAFLFDDEIVSGMTVQNAVRQLVLGGISSIDIGITYAFCSGDVLEAVAKWPQVRSLTVSDLIWRPSQPPCFVLPLAQQLLEKISHDIC